MNGKRDFEKSLRIALSQCQKLRTACAECDQALKTGGLSPDRHRDLIHRYHYDIQVAEAAAAKIRTQCGRYRDSLAATRAGVVDQQRTLMEKVAANRIAPQQANDLNHRYVNEIKKLDDDIQHLDHVKAARSADQLGGFIDLPLDRYAHLLPAVVPQASVWQTWIACVLAAIAVVAVFIPWTWRGATAISLFQWFFHGSVFAASPLRWVWICWCLLPLIALPVAFQRKNRWAGWGLLAVGLVVFAGGLLPGLAFGTAPADTALLAAIFRLYHVGSILYCLSGVGFIYLGALRVAPASESLAATVRQAAVAGGILLFSMVLLIAVTALVRRAPQLNFEATLTNPPRGLVTVVVRNNGSLSQTVAVPREADGEASYGLDVRVRMPGEETFNAMDPSGDMWKFRGDSIGQGRAVEVQPGLSLSLLLDLYEVRRLIPEADAVEVRLVSGENSPKEAVRIAIPERLVGPREVRRVAPLARSPAPAPVAPAQPIEPPAVQPPAAAEPAVQPVYVRFAGRIGDKFIFQFPGTGGEKRIVAGEELFYPWDMASATDSPSRVTFRHARTGQTVMIAQGETIGLDPTR